MRGRDTAWNVLPAAVKSRDAGAGEVKKCALAKDRLVTLDLILIERVVPMAEHIRVFAGAVITLPSGQRKVPAIAPRGRDLRLRRELDRQLLAFVSRSALQFAVLTVAGGERGFLGGSFCGKRRRDRFAGQRKFQDQNLRRSQSHSGADELPVAVEHRTDLVIAGSEAADTE